MSSKRPPYLSDLLPPLQRYQQNQGYFQSLLCRTKSSKTLFLLYTISQWNKLDPEIRRIGLCVGFQKKTKKNKVLLNLLKIRPLVFTTLQELNSFIDRELILVT